MQHTYFLPFRYFHLPQLVKTLSLLLFTLALGLARSHAKDYTVNNTSDGPAENQLRGAVAAAIAFGPGPHTIALAAGTYNLTMGSIQVGATVDITITGAGAASTIIDGGNLNRIFFFNVTGFTSGIKVALSNMTLRNGQLTEDSFGGGAVLCGGPANVYSFTNCIFSNNSIATNRTTPGGAIRLSAGGSLTVSNCTFLNNSNAKSEGGAIRFDLQGSESGSFDIHNNVFEGNHADANNAAGGAISVGVGTTGTFSGSITENSFVNNTANGGWGGAILMNNGKAGTTVNINYNRFKGNTSNVANASALAIADASGAANYTNNWWGCNSGAAGCADKAGKPDNTALAATPYLQLRATIDNAALCTASPGNTATITASFSKNSANQDIASANLGAFNGVAVSFNVSSGSAGQTTFQSNGTATATYTAGPAGSATINAIADNVPGDAATLTRMSVNVTESVTIGAGGQPQSVTPCPGGTASFTVTASGSGPLTYQWYKGATPISNGNTGAGATITGATGPTLTIANASAVDNATNYNVKVFSSCNPSGLQSNNASLTIITLPTPTAPTAQAACIGESVTFNASATGTPPFTYQWRKGTTNLVNGTTANGSVISGATTSQLTISGLKAADAASNYNYIVNNGCPTSAFSASARLTVNAPPSNVVATGYQGCVGDFAVLSVNASSSTTLQYAWYKGNEKLVDGLSASGGVITGADLNNLAIKLSDRADNGNDYYVKVTNACTTVNSSNVALQVTNSLPLASLAVTKSVGQDFDKIYGDDCNLIASLYVSSSQPGPPPLMTVNAKVWVETSAQAHGSGYYLARHYELTPEDPEPAYITLYFTQAEFDAYNLLADHGPDLPHNAGDNGNANNIRVIKVNGTSNDGTGLLDSYASQPVTITPTEVTFDAGAGTWAVSFPVTDYSGFFLTTDPIALPVSLISFHANVMPNRTVAINWTTASESQNKGFIVERSKDMRVFEKIAEVNAAKPDAAVRTSYRITDEQPVQGTSYYRLTQLDVDGHETMYRAVAVVVRDAPYGPFPNPVIRGSNITLSLDEPGTATISLIDMKGNAVAFERIQANAESAVIRPLSAWRQGIYMLTVTERGQRRTYRLLVE